MEQPFPPHQQRMQGFVVGFKGAKVFCLHYLSMTTIDVPQSATLYRYIEKKDFDGNALVLPLSLFVGLRVCLVARCADLWTPFPLCEVSFLMRERPVVGA